MANRWTHIDHLTKGQLSLRQIQPPPRVLRKFTGFDHSHIYLGSSPGNGWAFHTTQAHTRHTSLSGAAYNTHHDTHTSLILEAAVRALRSLRRDTASPLFIITPELFSSIKHILEKAQLLISHDRLRDVHSVWVIPLLHFGGLSLFAKRSSLSTELAHAITLANNNTHTSRSFPSRIFPTWVHWPFNTHTNSWVSSHIVSALKRDTTLALWDTWRLRDHSPNFSFGEFRLLRLLAFHPQLPQVLQISTSQWFTSPQMLEHKLLPICPCSPGIKGVGRKWISRNSPDLPSCTLSHFKKCPFFSPSSTGITQLLLASWNIITDNTPPNIHDIWKDFTLPLFTRQARADYQITGLSHSTSKILTSSWLRIFICEYESFRKTFFNFTSGSISLFLERD